MFKIEGLWVRVPAIAHQTAKGLALELFGQPYKL